MSVNFKIILPVAIAASSGFITLAPLAASAQVPQSPATLAYTIHDDLLSCYSKLGKGPETEAEYRWLLTQKPGNGPYHFNYALFLQRAGKNAAALVEYKKAAGIDSSNVDAVGACGQMMLFLRDYRGAYGYLMRAVGLPGGDKYKGSLDTCRQYIQSQDQQRAIQAAPKSGAGATAGGKKPKDDDDD